MLGFLLLLFAAATHAQLNVDKMFKAYPGYDMDPNNDTISLNPADWHPACDPWKFGDPVTDEHYEKLDMHPSRSPDDTYVCPEELRSPSGCGDFRDDPREMECPDGGLYDDMTDETETQSPTVTCSDQRIAANDPDKTWQFHACVQHPIYYTYKSTVPTAVWPPSTGRHRERWPKWGEFEFLPEQRWLHGAEHGGLVFLYNPCLIVKEDLCKLRQFIAGLPKYFVNDYRFKKMGTDRDDMTDLRFLLTPYKNLRKEFAIVVFNGIYFSKCWNVPGMLNFIKEHYREAWEDWPPPGPYDYLWQDYTAQPECKVNDKTIAEIYKPYGGFPAQDFNLGPVGARWATCVEMNKKPEQIASLAFKGEPAECYEKCLEGIPKKSGGTKSCKFWAWDATKGRCLLYGKVKSDILGEESTYGGKIGCHPWKGEIETE